MSPARMYSLATSTARWYAPLGNDEVATGKTSSRCGGSTGVYGKGRASSSTAFSARTDASSYKRFNSSVVKACELLPTTGTLSMRYTRWRQ